MIKMKYSQFVELNQLLENNNLSTQDLKKENVLNEIGILTPLAFAAAGIGLLFRKRILSWGLKKIYVNKLTNIANKFRETIGETIDKSIKTYQNKIKKIKNVGDDFQQAKQLLDLQSQVLKIINKSVDNLTDLKTKEVYEKIEKSKKMNESSKLALKYYWETLTTDIKVGALTDLVSKNIITNKKIKEKIDKYIKSKEEVLKTKERDVKANIKNVQQEDQKFKSKTYYENEIQNIKQDMEKPEKESEKEDLLNKVKELLIKADRNLTNDEYNNLIDKIPDIEGLSKNQIRSSEGLREIIF